MADYYLPDNEVNTRKPWQLLKDIWWALRSRTGSVLRAPITRYNSKGVPDGETTAEAEFGWNRENIASIRWAQTQQDAKLDNIIKKLGA